MTHPCKAQATVTKTELRVFLTCKEACMGFILHDSHLVFNVGMPVLSLICITVELLYCPLFMSL